MNTETRGHIDYIGSAENPYQFTFYHDPGHGWVEVWIPWLEKLAIQDKISSYSYKNNNYAYLEEDCDATLFFQTLKRLGVSYYVRNVHTDKMSPIRSYKSYTTEGEKSNYGLCIHHR